jgi:hypothetical protein
MRENRQAGFTVRTGHYVVTPYGPQRLEKAADFHAPRRGRQVDDFSGSLAYPKGL